MAAPPTTAIYHKRFEGWTVSDHIAAESLHEHRKLGWRYAAIHFENGASVPFPEPITHPGVEVVEAEPEFTWETATIDDLMSPEVRKMLSS